MENPETIRESLASATGTERYWLVFPGNNDFKITDGVKLMADLCEAYWLVTDIFLWQSPKKLKREAFQVWTLKFQDGDKDHGALLTGEDGNDRELARQEIEFTDFPLQEGVKLFLENGVLMLPSEY